MVHRGLRLGRSHSLSASLFDFVLRGVSFPFSFNLSVAFECFYRIVNQIREKIRIS